MPIQYIFIFCAHFKDNYFLWNSVRTTIVTICYITRFVSIKNIFLMNSILKNVFYLRIYSSERTLISEGWYKFIKNSQICCKPGSYLTTNEHWFPTKARCRLTQQTRQIWREILIVSIY